MKNKAYIFILLLTLAIFISCENSPEALRPIDSWITCTLFEKNLIGENGKIAGVVRGEATTDSIVINYNLSNGSTFKEIKFSLADNPDMLLDTAAITIHYKVFRFECQKLNSQKYQFVVKPNLIGFSQPTLYAVACANLSEKESQKIKIVYAEGLPFGCEDSEGKMYFTFQFVCKLPPTLTN